MCAPMISSKSNCFSKSEFMGQCYIKYIVFIHLPKINFNVGIQLWSIISFVHSSYLDKNVY